VRDHHHHPPDRVGRMPDRAIRRTTVRPMPAPPTAAVMGSRPRGSRNVAEPLSRSALRGLLRGRNQPEAHPQKIAYKPHFKEF
jgi:hypothetical protein